MLLPPTVTEPWVADCWSATAAAGLPPSAGLASSSAKAGRFKARPSTRAPVMDRGFIGDSCYVLLQGLSTKRGRPYSRVSQVVLDHRCVPRFRPKLGISR